MQFHVAGQNTYTLLIPTQAIFDTDGMECEGLALESRRLILISPRVELERREEILLHELQHAWEFHVPPPVTQEQRCQMFAAIAQQMRFDLGDTGIADLLKMRAAPVPDVGSPARVKSIGCEESWGKDRMVCGGCEAYMMCGSIMNSTATFNKPSATMQMDRWFECEACGSVQIWREVCTSDGQPTGQLVQVPAPRLLRGREATAWIREHGALA